MDSVYRLVMRTGPTVGKVFPLNKGEIFIGRDTANDISINDPEVSRRHARIFVQGYNFILEDLGSTNGTLVNGQRLMGPYVLHPGELIILGEQVSLLFEPPMPFVETTVASSATQPQEQSYIYQHEQSSVPHPEAQPMPMYQPAYSGQIPTQQEFYEEETVEKKKFPVWLIAVIILLLMMICVCVASLIIIDSNSLWCEIFGFFFNTLTPGACP